MFGTRTSKLRKCIASVLASGVASVALLGIMSTPAHASLTYGPTGGSQLSGSAWCDTVHHQISISYTATPEYTVTGTGLYPTMVPTPEWVEVWAYTRVSGTSTWGAVAHGQAYVTGTTTVLSSLQNAKYFGKYYDVGFMVRAAYPGGTWTNWTWDNPDDLRTSYSGSIFAQYGYCQA